MGPGVVNETGFLAALCFHFMHGIVNGVSAGDTYCTIWDAKQFLKTLLPLYRLSTLAVRPQERGVGTQVSLSDARRLFCDRVLN